METYHVPTVYGAIIPMPQKYNALPLGSTLVKYARKAPTVKSLTRTVTERELVPIRPQLHIRITVAVIGRLITSPDVNIFAYPHCL